MELTDISVSVSGRMVVHGVSLAVRRGSLTLLLGPNGSGKSSLLQAIAGHPRYPITAGKLTIAGEDYTTRPAEERARGGLFFSPQHVPRIGGVPLATFLHRVHVARGGDVPDVLTYYLTLRELAKRYALSDTLLDKAVGDGLSGGEKKLAEALQLAALKPRFALLDELDSGVDRDALAHIGAIIEDVRSGGTGVLLCSHAPGLLEYLAPSTVLLMSGGTIVRTGGRELAELVHREGYCAATECPVREECGARDGG